MFQTKNKVLKNLTQQEVINLLDTKKLTIEELNNLRNLIILELDNRNNNELEIAKEYKSFKVKDFSLTQNDVVIDFIINKDGLLLGTDEHLNFYIGKVNKNLHIVLFAFDNTYSHLVFRGKFDSSYKYYYGPYWHSEEETVNALNNFDFSSCDDGVYNEIINQNIDSLKTQVQLAYQKQYNSKNVDIILNVLKNNNSKNSKVLKKEL